MKCKYCLAELTEEVSVCPHCGADLTATAEQTEETSPVAEESTEEVEEIAAEQEETAEALTEETETLICEEQDAAPAKKVKWWKLVLVGAAVLVLLAALAIAIFWPSTGKALLRSVGIRANDVMYKDSYTVEDQVAADNTDVVVATVGDRELTSSQLQVYYWMGVSDFMNYYGSYLSMIGFDYNKGFDQQVYDPTTGQTYQQMFLDTALETWSRYATLLEMADEAGFQLSEDEQEQVDGFDDQVQELATAMEYEDVDKFLQEQLAPGTSLSGYLGYVTDSFVAMAYYDSLYESLLPTDEEVAAYFEEHAAEFAESGFSKESGNYYDVRHILIPIEGGTEDESGNVVYSDQDWTDCRNKAQALLDEFLAGEATEEIFASMAQEHSTDGGSNTNGGLYSQLSEATNFVDTFKNWYLDETRKPGDTGLVESVHGCHIMYFSSSYPIWEYEAESMLLSDKTSQMLEEAQEEWPMKVDFKKIVLGYVNPFATE